MKINANLDDALPLNKTIEIPTIKSVLHEIINIIHKFSWIKVCIKRKNENRNKRYWY